MMLFFAMSFLMGLSSPFYSGPQTALMQEKVPPEYLGRVFGLYGAIMSWAMPLGLAFSSLFADAVGAPAWFVGAGAAMVALACVTCPLLLATVACHAQVKLAQEALLAVEGAGDVQVVVLLAVRGGAVTVDLDAPSTKLIAGDAVEVPGARACELARA